MPISFDSNNLENSYLLINKINKSDAPDREIQTENLAFQDGFEVQANFWRSRKIVVAGILDATSTAHLGSLLDTLKQNLSGINKNLDVDYGAGTRRYKGTLTRLEAPEEFYNITHLPYTAEFVCQPFGYGTSTVSFTSNDITASENTESVSITGTYKPQPTITITFDSASDCTSCVVKNDTTGDEMTIEETLTDDDVIVINTQEHKVTLNGTQIDFTGPIPSFATGTNSVTITIGSTSHQYDLSITHLPRYL